LVAPTRKLAVTKRAVKVGTWPLRPAHGGVDKSAQWGATAGLWCACSGRHVIGRVDIHHRLFRRAMGGLVAV